MSNDLASLCGFATCQHPNADVLHVFALCVMTLRVLILDVMGTIDACPIWARLKYPL